MKRIKKIGQLILVTVLAVAITLGISACGGDDKELSPSEARDALEKSQEEIPLSEALNDGRTLWYYADSDAIGKDGSFELYVFEGGEVTYYEEVPYYEEGNVTFGDINGLSDDEIISLVDNSNAEKYDAHIAGFKDRQLADTLPKYQSPKSFPYALEISTDKTGNNVESEIITFEYEESIGVFEAMEDEEEYRKAVREAYNNKTISNKKIEIMDFAGTYTVYENQYGGFSDRIKEFVKAIDKPIIFTFDKIGTKGITVN